MNPKLNRHRGKRTEKAIEKLIPGSKRVGIFGGEDLNHERFSIEVKSRKSFVVDKWMAQAKKNSKGKNPLVIVHVLNSKHEKDYVIMYMETFKSMIGA